MKYPLEKEHKETIDWNMAKIVCLVIMALITGSMLCLLLSSCSPLNERMGKEDDWIGEEILESALETAIQVETGYRPSIDLTPGSPEK